MRAGVHYLIYQSAPVAEVGRDCRFGSSERTVGVFGAGSLSRSEVLARGIAPTVTLDGREYQLAARIHNDNDDREIPVSCTGGPVLAEELPGYIVGTQVARWTVIALVVCSAAVGAWSARRRAARPAGELG